MQFSDRLLAYLGGPKLPELTANNAEVLPEFPNYLDVATINFIAGTRFTKSELNNIYITLLRQTLNSKRQYESGRLELQAYVDALGSNHLIFSYFRALDHFENCLGAICKAAELERTARKQLLPTGHQDIDLYSRGDGSALQRIAEINNTCKHWSAEQAKNATSPIWITNNGISSHFSEVHFGEVKSMISWLFDLCNEVFVALPDRRRNSSKDVQAG